MALLYSLETANAGLTPPQTMSDVALRGRLKIMRGTITLDPIVAANDYVFIGNRPAGSRFVALILTSSVDIGSTVVNVGTSTTHSSNNKYHSANLNSLVNAPVLRGLVSVMDDEPLTADEAIYVTFSADPPDGTLIVDVLYVES